MGTHRNKETSSTRATDGGEEADSCRTMSIPFSNTHYRIPRGFASLLEGLTREVLREQPEDIPNFAARYFSELLKKREESGFDSAEWGAALEDRYYNNHSFQHPEEKTFTARTDVSSAEDGHLSRDLIASTREEGGHKLAGALPAHSEDVTDRRQSVAVLERSEDASEPQPRPSSSQTAQVTHKQDEERDADNLLRDQSATIIQAAFRGHQARDGVRKLKEEPGRNEGITERDSETPQVNPTAPQDSNVATQSLPDDGDIKEDVSGGGIIRDEDLEARARQNQAKEEQKEDDPENLVKDEIEQHNLHQTQEEKDNLASTQDVKGQDLRDEAKEDNLTTTEDVKDQDLRDEAKEDNLTTTEDVKDQDLIEETKEDTLASTESMEGEDHREEAMMNILASTEDMEGQDHRAEAKEANQAITEDMEGQDHREEVKENVNLAEDDGDREGKRIETWGLEVSGGQSSEGTDSRLTQEDHSHEATMTEEQRESADNQDNNETKEQPEAKEEEPADITTHQEQPEGRGDPQEENEALRKQTEEALDIALDDPDANAAAAKIQAGFRGHMTRKKMKSGDKDVKHKEGKEGTSAQGEHEGD